jgi:carboxylate-amine ligase
VHRDDLAVYPVGDRVLAAAGARLGDEVVRGDVRWSNELMLHVIELKTNGPRASLDGLSASLAASEREMEGLLEPHGGRLLPTAMHPTMDPLREARLWPHEYGEVYRAYDRLFGCKGHGFANLQSVHVNLPFSGDREFARLHAAVRLVLPILPALAASSPLVEGKATGALDARLLAYRQNQRRIPSVTGSVIPERVSTRAEYEDRVLGVIARDIALLDTEGVLEAEWVNSRGAIARFSRSAIEIRVLDAQECALSDVTIAAAAIRVVRALTDEKWTSSREQGEFHESRLLPLFMQAAILGGDAVVADAAYLRSFGVKDGRLSLRELWAQLAASLDVAVDGGRDALDVILRHGSLSERILRALRGDLRPPNLRRVYGALAESMRENRPFVP